MTQRARIAAGMAVALALAGCATAPATPGDPLEGVNRAVFSFNEAIDAALLKPVATGYQAVVPQIVRAGVDNFFANFGDAWSAVNHLLQAKPAAAFEMGLRFGFNTVFGIFGLLDIAGEAGIERRSEDFGQTLGYWGLKPGPYLVLPLLGPSTLRDTTALVTLDSRASPTALSNESRDRYAIAGLLAISTRARLLSASKAIDDIALDKYSLIRDGFLARRRNQVYDGNPPEEPDPPEEGAEAPPKQ